MSADIVDIGPPAEDPDPEPESAADRLRQKLRVIQGGAGDESEDDESTGYPDDVQRPRTRGECAEMPRPCPWVSCKYHLYPEILRQTRDMRNVRHHDGIPEPWEMDETCSLDLADRGGVTLDEVAKILGVTRERVRQIESRALVKLEKRGDAFELRPLRRRPK